MIPIILRVEWGFLLFRDSESFKSIIGIFLPDSGIINKPYNITAAMNPIIQPIHIKNKYVERSKVEPKVLRRIIKLLLL